MEEKQRYNQLGKLTLAPACRRGQSRMKFQPEGQSRGDPRRSQHSPSRADGFRSLPDSLPVIIRSVLASLKVPSSASHSILTVSLILRPRYDAYAATCALPSPSMAPPLWPHTHAAIFSTSNSACSKRHLGPRTASLPRLLSSHPSMQNCTGYPALLQSPYEGITNNQHPYPH